MASTGQWPLQQAIYGVLTADATLMALISGVYDFVPAGAEYPYIAIGDAKGQDASSLGSPGMKYGIILNVYSQQGGRKEAAAIIDRAYTLLNGANLSVSGQTLVYLHATASTIALQKDGVTYCGELKLRAVLQG